MTASPSGAGRWVERYEAWRAHAVGQGTLGFMPLGLAVLRHRGVVAWMEVEGQVVERAIAGPVGPVASVEGEGIGSAPTPLPRSELVTLLASTALLVAAGGQR